MKKRKQFMSNGNVIQFPDLEKRLLEKGEENLQQHHYSEAISIFEQAIKLDSESSDSHLGLVLAYYGAGFVEQAIHLAKKMLQEDLGNYIEIMDLYLLLLSQIHKHEEVVTAIEGLLEERSIPGEKLEHFYSMLDLNRKMMDTQQGIEVESPLSNRPVKKELHLRNIVDPQEQLILVAQLANGNIIPYLDEMKEYLQWDEGTPGTSGTLFFKTLLINVLKEHEFDKPITVYKLGKVMTIIPKSLSDTYDNPQLKEITHLIGQKLEHDNPVLFESIQALIKRQFFLLYPFELEMVDLSACAVAYHALGNEYYGIHNTEGELIKEYQVMEANMKKADSFIRMIEEISYSNI